MFKKSELEAAAPWLVFVFTLICGFMRVYLLEHQGLWLDEAFSVWMASHPIPDMFQWLVRVDQHPPLYYILLHYWMLLTSDSAYYTRLLSALLGALTIPVMYLIGNRIAGRIMGLAAAVGMGFSLFNIYYGQEARMYTFLTFNAAVAIYALVRLLSDPCALQPIGSQFREYARAWRTAGPVETSVQKEFSYRDETRQKNGLRGWASRHRWLPIQAVSADLAWIVFVVFSAAILLSHNTAVLYFVAINLYMLGLILYQRARRSGPLPAFQAPSVGNWVKAQVGILVLWSPWLLSFIQQARTVDRQFWIPAPTWEAVTRTLRGFLNPSAPGQVSQAITWILCGLLLLGLFFFRKKLSIFFFLLALFAVPFLGELLVSIRRPIFYDRTLIWITIPMFLLLAAGITQLKFNSLIVAALGVVIANSLFSTGDYYRHMRKENWDAPAGYVSLKVEEGDLVLFNSPMVQVAFDYYYRDYEKLKFFQVERHGVPDMFESGQPESRMTTDEIPRLVSLLEGHKQVFLVYSHETYSDPDGLVPQTLAGRMKLIETREFFGGQVQRYQAP